MIVREADASTKRPEARHERREQAKASPSASGNAAQDARRGTAQGQESATASSASPNTNAAAQQGNSTAATNYPGKVWRKLSRGRRSRSAGRGTAVVAFRIAANGGLAGVSIAQSSGKPRLDQAALRHVQRAAPFPPPPPGARTRFSFAYEVN